MLAAAIFGLTSFFNRAHAPLTQVNGHINSKEIKTKTVYTRDQLMAVNASTVPAPDRLVLRRLVTCGVNREPWPDVPPLPKRKTRRGVAGGRRRPIRPVTGHRPPPLPESPPDTTDAPPPRCQNSEYEQPYKDQL